MNQCGERLVVLVPLLRSRIINCHFLLIKFTHGRYECYCARPPPDSDISDPSFVSVCKYLKVEKNRNINIFFCMFTFDQKKEIIGKVILSENMRVSREKSHNT